MLCYFVPQGTRCFGAQVSGPRKFLLEAYRLHTILRYLPDGSGVHQTVRYIQRQSQVFVVIVYALLSFFATCLFSVGADCCGGTLDVHKHSSLLWAPPCSLCGIICHFVCVKGPRLRLCPAASFSRHGWIKGGRHF